MERHLPIVDIGGTAFYVDVLREELRQTDNPENRISFDVLEACKTGYQLWFDTENKNVPESGQGGAIQAEGCIKIMLPALMELDPEGIALKYGIPLEMLRP